MSKRVILTGNTEHSIFYLRAELVQRLTEEGYEVYAAYAGSVFGDGYTTCKNYHCRFLELPMDRYGKNPLHDLVLLKTYLQIFRQLRPDMVFTFTIKPNVYGGLAAALCGIPCVMNICGLGIPLENPGPMRWLLVGLYRLACRKVQRVFLQNTENLAFFEKRHLADGKRKLLPGSGVNLTRFPLLDYPRGETVHFLYIARIQKRKGIDQYLEAARAIHEKYPHTVFHILGPCEEADCLDRILKLQQAGAVCYHGLQRDTLPYQAISACTVHPTYYPEGISNVLLETAACGRPIIATDRSGCREILEDGVNGLVCRARDSRDLTEKLEAFLHLSWEQRRDMGLAGRKKAEQEFDRNLVLDAYLEELGKAPSGGSHEQ